MQTFEEAATAAPIAQRVTGDMYVVMAPMVGMLGPSVIPLLAVDLCAHITNYLYGLDQQAKAREEHEHEPVG